MLATPGSESSREAISFGTGNCNETGVNMAPRPTSGILRLTRKLFVPLLAEQGRGDFFQSSKRHLAESRRSAINTTEIKQLGFLSSSLGSGRNGRATMQDEVTITRASTYIGFFLGLFMVHLLLRGSTWQSSAEFHVLLEANTTLLSLLVGIMALALYYRTETNLYWLIGIGFLGAGLLNGCHAIISSPPFADLLLSTLPSLIPWSGIAPALFLSVCLWFSSQARESEARTGELGEISGCKIYVAVGLLTLAGSLFFAFLPVPEAAIERPEEFVPASFFLLALVRYLRKGDWRHDVFEHWLVLFLIVGFAYQAMFMLFSGRAFDGMAAAGHFLKMADNFFVLPGLIFGTYHLFRLVEERTHEVGRTNEILRRKIGHREQAQESLEKAHEAVEVWILEQTSQLAQINKMLEREIAEHKRAEAALRESEERFHKIFDEGPLGMAIVDLDCRFITVNNALCRMLGYSEEELTGLTIAEITHPDDIEKNAQLAEKVFGEQVPYFNTEKRCFKKNGEILWIALTATNVRDEDGKPLYGLAMIEEITERKQVEEAAENIQEVFWITSLNPTKVVYVSRAYEKIWGHTRESLYEHSLAWLDAIHPKDQERVGDAIRRQTSGEVSVEYRIVRADEAVRWIWGRAFPMRDERGEVCRIVGVATDITERKRLEKEILEISAREQRRIGQDLHDGLGQHLTGIAFLSKVLEQKLATKSLGESAEAAEIATLVNQAITQTRDLARGLCPVRLAGNGLVEALKELAAKTEGLFRVACSFQCELPILIHDNAVATHLYYITQEAVTNAIKHGKAQHIVIGLTAANDLITLMVKDDGIGFPKGGKKHTGMGLRIMNYRASMIDAYLVIQPHAEGGTLLTCSLRHEGTIRGREKKARRRKPARVKRERRHDHEARSGAQGKRSKDAHRG